MDSKLSAEPRSGGQRPPIPVKLVIAGGFGVGKTTAVSAVSEIVPLTTEAAITSVAAEIDARDRLSVRDALLAVLRHTLVRVDAR